MQHNQRSAVFWNNYVQLLAAVVEGQSMRLHPQRLRQAFSPVFFVNLAELFLDEFMLLHHLPFKSFPLRFGQQSEQPLQPFSDCRVSHDYVLAVEGTQCLFMVRVLVDATGEGTGQ